jgi:hypothetical protein
LRQPPSVTHPLVLLVISTGRHGEDGFAILSECLEHLDVGSTVLVEVSSHVLNDTGGIWGQVDGSWTWESSVRRPSCRREQ